MKSVLAAIGAIVLAFHLAASLGIGHFQLIYSGTPYQCVEVNALADEQKK
ncbi:hypothetical protein LMG26858_00892 [Achromobacter anxifer]|uniref:Uncharacterized protein n=1 Tax=Achromobacter anxifer TaxID=1287737 RepID=A0A6S7CFK9_9BURK|nr:hypothetical protein [Achromobacter anxifer]CAB3835028.1 hypothetical protein LMG26858_00892 [Achromobacter anxifer]